MSARRLDLLPNEIIQRILAYGTCLSALKCRSVCRHLKTICDDPAIYVSIIYSSNGVSLLDHEEAAVKWPLLRSLRTEKDWRVCARYALADMSLASFITGDASDWEWDNPFYRCCWRWLPELLLTEHRAAITDGVSISRTHQLSAYTSRVQWVLSGWLTGSYDMEHYHEIAIRLIFMAVCGIFRNATSLNRVIDLPDDALRTYQKTLRFHFDNVGYFLVEAFLPMIDHSFETSLFATFKLLEQTTVMSTWRTTADQELHWSRCTVLCIVIAPMMFECVLRSDSNESELPGSSMEFDAYLGLPPVPLDIPFLDFCQVDPPFHYKATMAGLNGFATRHLPTMTSAAFLEDGQWCGYFFDEGIDREETLAVHNLSITVTSDCADHCTVSGKCERMIDGHMTLTGTLFKQTGWAQLDGIIQGPNGLRRAAPLSVMLTPFGIIGSWKLNPTPTTYRSAGWLWLWKKSWQSKRIEPVWKRPPDTVLSAS